MKPFKLTYSHCVQFTHGQLDREPFSKYESRTVDAEFRVWDVDADNDKVEYQVLVLGKAVSGCHVDPKEAIADAQYQLMDASRSVINPEWEKLGPKADIHFLFNAEAFKTPKL